VLQIVTTAPVASIPALSPNPRNTPVSSLPIRFSEPVSGFGLQDLQLTLNGISTPLGEATLTSSDNQNWTLGNLAGLTTAQGSYALTLTAAGWGITDQFGNLLTANATNTWVMDTTPPTASFAVVEQNPATTPVDSLTIQFSEPVSSFTLQDLALSFNGTAASLSGATLTSNDNQNWTLGNLSGLTWQDGVYQLALSAARLGVTDLAGNAIAGNPSTSWTMSAGTIQDSTPGQTIRIVANAADSSKADVYLNGSSPSYTAALAGFSQWNITAATGDVVIVDFSQGNPLPANGLLLDGGGSTLWIDGTSASDVVTVGDGQILVGTGPAISYSNVAAFGFALGGGQGTLTGTAGLNESGSGTLIIAAANQYSGPTTVSGGTLVATNSQALPSGGLLSIGPGGSVVLGDPGAAEPLAAAQAAPGGALQAVVAAAGLSGTEPASLVASNASVTPAGGGPGSPAVSYSVLAAVAAPVPTAAVAPAAVDRLLATQPVPESNAVASTIVGRVSLSRPSPVRLMPSGWWSIPLPASPVPHSDVATVDRAGGQPAEDTTPRVAVLRTAASGQPTDEALLRIVDARPVNAASWAGNQRPATRLFGLDLQTLDLLHGGLL
jgi:autotransporter-associated beta strand protein